MLKFTIPGRPVPAVRMTQRSKYVSKQAQRYLAYKEQIGWSAKIAGANPTEGHCEVVVNVYFNFSRSMDIDNLAKSFLDGMNGIAWIDDKQVMKLDIELFDEKENQRVEVEIIERVTACN